MGFVVWGLWIVDVLRRALGAYCILLAAVVGLQFMLVTLYDDGGSGDRVWGVINWFSAAAILIALGAGLAWKRAAGPAETRRRLDANALFYAALALAILFFWNWAARSAGSDDFLVWAAVDALIVAVAGAAGFRLWREAGGREGRGG